MSNLSNRTPKIFTKEEIDKLKSLPIFEESRFIRYDWCQDYKNGGTSTNVIVNINLDDNPYYDGSGRVGHTMCYTFLIEELTGYYLTTILTKEYVANVICRRIQDAFKRWNGDPQCEESRKERKLVAEHFRIIREFTAQEVHDISKTDTFKSTKYLHWQWDVFNGTATCYVNCYLDALLELYQGFKVNVGQVEGWSLDQIKAFIEMAIAQRAHRQKRENEDCEDYSEQMLENLELHFDKLKQGE